jgi:membrane protein implicated in regulation of membrane protease activity
VIGVITFLAQHALLGWLAFGAVLLIVELSTGSGWLLWPAGSAAVAGLVALAPGVGLTAQVVAFAVLTIASTYVGRRVIDRGERRDHDPNDPYARLIGRTGQAATTFEGGVGRVFVDGKEWAAELEDNDAVAQGARVKVVALVGGARLKVRAA